MSVLAEVYASNPSDEYIIHALDIILSDNEIIRVCNGYENLILSDKEYEAGNISVSLPRRANFGQQVLTFDVWNAFGIAQDYVYKSLERNDNVYVVYHQYLSDDMNNPIYSTKKMSINGGSFSGLYARFEASFADMLNTAFPRQRYTNESAPAIQYMS